MDHDVTPCSKLPGAMKPILQATILALAVMIGGACTSGTSMLKAHSTAAQTLDELAVGAKTYVFAQREIVLVDAANKAKADGLDQVELKAAVERAASTYDAGPAIPAVNSLIQSKDAYVRIILSLASQDSPSWSQAREVLRSVVSAYSSLRAALGNPSKLPPVPESIFALLAFDTSAFDRSLTQEVFA